MENQQSAKVEEEESSDQSTMTKQKSNDEKVKEQFDVKRESDVNEYIEKVKESTGGTEMTRQTTKDDKSQGYFKFHFIL